MVYVLRMQRERMLPGEAYVPSLREYTLRYGINSSRLRPGQLGMHPGPMNRGVEISDEVADSAGSPMRDTPTEIFRRTTSWCTTTGWC